MQDIPRNELLDKLAAGWKVRRKGWQQGMFSPNFFHQDDLIADEWEGEPPGPVCTANGCSIVHAFERLFDGAAFIRRTSWKDKEKRYTQGVFSVSLQVEELLATDWEVWG